MKLLLYLYVLSVSCKIQDAIVNPNVPRTTNSHSEHKNHEERCYVGFATGNYTLEQEEFKSELDRKIRNYEILKINLSKCGFEIVNKHLCNLCFIPRNVSVDISWNSIRKLDEFECNCPGIKEINLSDNELTVLGANSFIFAQYVIRVYISGNNIYNLEEQVFNEIRMLEVLDLSRNALRRIDRNIFNSLSNLRKLNLSKNKLQTIVPDALAELRNLEKLDISYNNIHSLDSRSFKGLENLEILNVALNRLTNPNLSFLSIFMNLSLVNLSGNNFVSFEEGSLNAFHIRTVILNNLSGLRYILDGAFRNGDCLTKFDLSRNKRLIFIEESAFKQMQDNITFDVSYTHLKAFPAVSHNMAIKATATPLRCECTSVADICSYNGSSQDKSQLIQNCVPSIVSHIAGDYFLYIGQRLELDCFAVGHPKPQVIWERIFYYSNGTISSLEQLARNYFLKLNILSLNMQGKYRCVAMSDGLIVRKNFNLNVKHIDIGLKVLSRNSHSILVAWNKTHHTRRHVLLYRTFETTSDYDIQKLNEFWKVFIVRSLHPFTEYEICVASFSDVNDKSCVRTMTSVPEKKSVGIRHNNLAITFLFISGIIFVVFLVVTIYRCIQKLRIILRQNIFIVGSESRECFANVTESTFTYENHYTERQIDTAY